jgi:sulfur carrier protein
MQQRSSQPISLVVNGVAVDTSARTLSDLVTEQGFAEAAVATALNGDFVPRQARTDARLAPGDRIEIVAPRQGG